MDSIFTSELTDSFQGLLWLRSCYGGPGPGLQIEVDHKEGWEPKNWCLWTVVLEKTLENPFDWKEIKPKGNQFWRTDGEAEALILWPVDVKNWLIGKDSDVGKDWRQEEKGTTEDEMVGWHHQVNGHEFEQAPGDGERQGSLACCSPWGRRVGHDWATEQQQPLYLF